MGLAVAGIAGGSLVRPWRWITPPDADLVVFNAKVYTMDAAVPRAEAFAVKDGRIVAVGSTAAKWILSGESTGVVDPGRLFPH